MTDERLEALRKHPLVGRGSCTAIDEAWEDAEIIDALDNSGVKTVSTAIQWALEEEEIWLEQGTNASSGEPDCPLVATYDKFIEAKGKLCEGCQTPTHNVTGMCYECECKAHAEGWFDQDTGYAKG